MAVILQEPCIELEEEKEDISVGSKPQRGILGGGG